MSRRQAIVNLQQVQQVRPLLNLSPPAPGHAVNQRHVGALLPWTNAISSSSQASSVQANTVIPQSQSQNFSSLEVGRPVSRPKNEYVDTPSKSTTTQKDFQTVSNRWNSNNSSSIVTQPKSTLKDKSTGPSPAVDVGTTESCTESIICVTCGRCRCHKCTAPRTLPKGWIGKQEVSADSLVDCCSCLCLVKCAFHFCFNYLDREDEEVVASDNPCGCCEQPHCCKRWGCMLIALPCVPCLALYPFLKGCTTLCTCVYDRATRTGCRCHSDRSSGSKALLESESSST